MTFRSIRYTVLLLIASAGLANSQVIEKDIRKLLEDQVDSWNKGNIEGFMKGYWNSDSTQFISGGKLVRGYSDVLARYKKSYDTREKMGKLEFSELAVRTVDSHIAIASGIWRLQRSNDQPWGRFTLIIEKRPEGWRIVYDHTSTATP
jgi:ketosteroid isomerase-like protein